MALEDRVKALEEEMNVLKNQIQATLLEIQEQVLMHYYPSLRGQASPSPGTAATGFRPEKANTRVSLPVPETAIPEASPQQLLPDELVHAFGTEASMRSTDITPTQLALEPADNGATVPASPAMSSEQMEQSVPLEEEDAVDAGEGPDPAANLPLIKHVSLDQVRQRISTKTTERRDAPQPQETDATLGLGPIASLQPHFANGGGAPDTQDLNPFPAFSGQSLREKITRAMPANLLTRPQGQLAVQANGRVPWTAFVDLLDWVSASVASIGTERTKTAAEIYSRAGYLAPEVHSIIFKLLCQTNGETCPENIGTAQVIDALLQLNAVIVRATAVSESQRHLEG